MPSLFDLFGFVIQIIEKLSYPGVFLLTFLESIFPPIPSEIIMGFSGFLIAKGTFSWAGVILAAVLGNALSSALVWFVGRRLGKPALAKWGKYIGFTEQDFQKGQDLFAKYGYWAVFFCQLIPLARSLISVPAGILQTRFWPFILSTVAGATIWLTFLTYIGFSLGDNWAEIETILKPFERLIVFLMVAIFLIVTFLWIKKKFLDKKGMR